MNTLILAHRGDRERFLENTLEALHSAIERGADGVEVDVQFSSDGVPFIFHDDTLGRLAVDRLAADLLVADRLERVSSLTWKELQKISLKGGARIPSLQDLIEQIAGKTLINLEIKGSLLPRRNRLALVALLKGQTHSKILISSFNPFTLWICRRILPGFPIGFLFHKKQGLVQSWILHMGLNPEAYHPNLKLLTPTMIEHYQKTGKQIFVWTVNEEADMAKMFSQGVTGIFTDCLSIALKLRASSKGE